MKKSNNCSKCHSTDIVKVPGHSGVHGAGNNVRIGHIYSKFIPVTRFICMECGFVEEWIEDKEQLERIRSEYGK